MEVSNSFEPYQSVSKSLKGRPKTAEHINKIKHSLIGKKFSSERKKKISESKIGKESWNKGIKDAEVECPHCLKIGGNSSMKRWHFNNCKKKDL